MPENNMKIIIREMQPEDVSAVAALEAECFSEPWSEQAFLDALKQSEAMMMVAVGMGNNPMGYCGIYLSADEGEITNVAVRPDYRKQWDCRCNSDRSVFRGTETRCPDYLSGSAGE